MIIFKKNDVIKIISGLQPDYFTLSELERNGFGVYYDFKQTFVWNKSKLEEFDLEYLEFLLSKLLNH